MRDLQLLPVEKFRRLSLADQRKYLRRIAEHLADALHIHADMSHPRVVASRKPPDSAR